MDAYWSEGQDIGDVDVLRGSPRELELPAERSRRCSTASATATGSRARRAQAASIGANAVPAFLLDRRLLVLGAQPEELFEQAFERLEERLEHPLRRRARRRLRLAGDAPMHRTSHALAVDGRVWLIDPIEGEGVDERIRGARRAGRRDPAARPAHRDVRGLRGAARRPAARRAGALPETPFEFLPVLRGPLVGEVALWWPERRILLCADALGTLPFFRAGDEPAGLHPFLRLWPPRSLRGLGAEHLLVGHGEGIHGTQSRPRVERHCGRGGAGSRAGSPGSRGSSAAGTS